MSFGSHCYKVNVMHRLLALCELTKCSSHLTAFGGDLANITTIQSLLMTQMPFVFPISPYEPCVYYFPLLIVLILSKIFLDLILYQTQFGKIDNSQIRDFSKARSI